jgi:multiple sugar transport system permease protein
VQASTTAAPRSRRRGPSAGVLFALPAMLVLGLIILYPLGHTAVLSVMDDAGRYVGLRNYERMAASATSRIALWNTVYYVGVSLVLQLAIGTALGILLDRRFRGRGAVRSLVLIPWIIPGIVAASTWAWMFHSEFGIINHVAITMGLTESPIGWLTEPALVLPALIAVNVWKMVPFVAIMVLAGLQAIPPALYEAARVDGAGFRHEVRHIMLPLLRPIIASIGLLLLIWGLNGITIIYAMTRGGPANRSLITPIQIYRQGFEFFRFGDAAALSVMFFAAVMVFVLLYVRRVRRGEA